MSITLLHQVHLLKALSDLTVWCCGQKIVYFSKPSQYLALFLFTSPQGLRILLHLWKPESRIYFLNQIWSHYSYIAWAYRYFFSLLLICFKSFLGAMALSSVAKIKLIFPRFFSLVWFGSVWNKIKIYLAQPVPWNAFLDFPFLIGGVLEIWLLAFQLGSSSYHQTSHKELEALSLGQIPQFFPLVMPYLVSISEYFVG